MTSFGNITDIQVHNVQAVSVRHDGIDGVLVTEPPGQSNDGEDKLAVIPDARLHNGVIEVDIAGRPSEGAQEQARGFVGIAFRVGADAGRFECLYIRPTNGRADDQLRRNHSTQYISFPDHPWHKLREETPGKYEAYADMVPGQWTKLKITVEGDGARLFVGGAEHPTLIVNDLKHGDTEGGVALWIGPGIEGFFANLRVSE